MREFVSASGHIVRIHDGELTKNGVATEKGKAVIGDAMTQFYKGILKEAPRYFDRVHKENKYV